MFVGKKNCFNTKTGANKNNFHDLKRKVQRKMMLKKAIYLPSKHKKSLRKFMHSDKGDPFDP